MIGEAIVGSVTAIVLGSLWLANAIDKRLSAPTSRVTDSTPLDDYTARKIALETARKEVLRLHNSAGTANSRAQMLDTIEKIDEQLLKLAISKVNR